MKAKNVSYKVAVVLTVIIYLALIRTIAEPLIEPVDAHDLPIYLGCAVFIAVSCLAMTILTFLSKTKLNTYVAAGTLIVMIAVKMVWLT